MSSVCKWGPRTSSAFLGQDRKKLAARERSRRLEQPRKSSLKAHVHKVNDEKLHFFVLFFSTSVVGLAATAIRFCNNMFLPQQKTFFFASDVALKRARVPNRKCKSAAKLCPFMIYKEVSNNENSSCSKKFFFRALLSPASMPAILEAIKSSPPPMQ